MKKIIYILLLILSISLVSAAEKEINFTDLTNYRSSGNFANLQINSLKYDPYPVNPGEYFTLWIKAENIGNKITKDATFMLEPKYPFSLDTNEDPYRTYGELRPEEQVVMEFKIRVDKNAVEGTNEIELKYNADGEEDYYAKKEFEIEVEDAQTDFDLVIQEVNVDETAIAIANTGKNIAYSVIVRIPEQTGFKVKGTNGQMVGNLEDGDYTLVGFALEPKEDTKNQMLKIQIDYTDEIGERRKVIKNMPIEMESSDFNQTGIAGMRGMNKTTTDAAYYTQWWFWTGIIVLLYLLSKISNWISRRKEKLAERKRETQRNKK